MWTWYLLASMPTLPQLLTALAQIIFRENTEDIYAGIEFQAGSPEALELIKFLESKGVAKNVKRGCERLADWSYSYCATVDPLP